MLGSECSTPVQQPGYSLAEVLAVAKIHPFYNPDVVYPPNFDDIQAVRKSAAQSPVDSCHIQDQPLLLKTELYKTVQRLVDDTSSKNIFRRSIYASTTGGGSGSKPLFFATDVYENRKQRAVFGQFLRTVGLVKDVDLVITTHTSGGLYRSLDLTLELLENAGATVLAAGHCLKPAEVIRLALVYHANVLSGDSSQMVQLVHYISTMSSEDRASLKVSKIIYTSETLTAGQREYINSVLGSVEICSILGSAEAGPYAVSCPQLTESSRIPPQVTATDFVFDTRQMLIEILPFESANGGKEHNALPLPKEEKGVVVQTSLTRLRNPVVRYVTGDLGSLHDLPPKAKHIVPENDWPYLRVLRLHGRDSRFSFEWNGEYIEFAALNSLMNESRFGILQWQAILGRAVTQDSFLEIRVLCQKGEDDVETARALEDATRRFFYLSEGDSQRFLLTFVNDLDAFVRSGTGRKVIKFVDRFNQ